MEYINTLKEFVTQNWPVVSTIAGIMAGLSVFLKNLLTIKKLKYEISRLENATEPQKKVIYEATIEEITKYGNPSEKKHGGILGDSIGEPYSSPAIKNNQYYIWLIIVVLGIVVYFLSNGNVWSLLIFLGVFVVLLAVYHFTNLGIRIERNKLILLNEFLKHFGRDVFQVSQEELVDKPREKRSYQSRAVRQGAWR